MKQIIVVAILIILLAGCVVDTTLTLPPFVIQDADPSVIVIRQTAPWTEMDNILPFSLDACYPNTSYAEGDK